MLKNTIILSFCLLLFFTITISCKAAIPEKIILNTPNYEKHTKGLVIFNHQKHNNDYGFKCEKCHHNKNGEPINNEKEIKQCVTCHKETNPKPKDEKLEKKEWIKKYHKKAIHTTCKECHKKFNKKNELKKGDPGAAPQDCKGCHPNKEK